MSTELHTKYFHVCELLAAFETNFLKSLFNNNNNNNSDKTNVRNNEVNQIAIDFEPQTTYQSKSNNQ